jgi:endonuclease/exonuclease/phosphatase family metal-dependent hydrolase
LAPQIKSYQTKNKEIKMKQIIKISCLLFILCLQGGIAGTKKESVRILALNAWHEGTRVKGGREKIAEVILKSEADLVAIPEGKASKNFANKLRPLLNEKKKYQVENLAGVTLVSRFPIIEPPKLLYPVQGVVAITVRMPNGRPLHFVAAHLDFKYYGTNLPRGYNGSDPDFKIHDPDGDGKPNPITELKTILDYNQKSKKDEAIKAFVQYAKPLLKKGECVVLAGDFNDASHLDWTDATKNLFDHNGTVIPWKNSLFLQQEGFIDSYRELHPDPVKAPGITWPSEAFGRGSTSWAPKSDDRDRVDYIYYARKGVRATASYLVGSQVYWKGKEKVKMKTKDDFLLESQDWPSDHKGVLTVLNLR